MSTPKFRGPLAARAQLGGDETETRSRGPWPRGAGRLWLCALAAVTLLWRPAAGASQESRRVLALYDSAEPLAELPCKNNIHSLLEMPLNYLGMVVDYHDVSRRPLPDASRYRAIVIWFTDDTMEKPVSYLLWLIKAAGGGTRIIAVSGLGAASSAEGKPVDDAILKEALAAVGVQLDGEARETGNPFVIAWKDAKPEAFNFETRTPPKDAPYRRYLPLNGMKAWRTISRTDVPNSAGLAVAVGPQGGVIPVHSWVVREFTKPTYGVLWDLNPFAFLEAALGCEKTLRLDVTTVCGLRAAYSHIDADGMANYTGAFTPEPVPSAEIVLKETLQRYPLPITVGFIAGRLDLKALGTPRLQKLAKEILALPNVQFGCHGYAHPLDWSKGIPGLKIPGYVFSNRIETVGAMEFLEREIAGGKRRVEVFQWTGDCRPGQEALALVAARGVASINGGEARLDNWHPSVSFVSPLARTVGKYRQIYASACNDYIYTNGLRENFGGFRNVIETFIRTGAPRRLLPVNVYYHFYSGERVAMLRALNDVYDWCLKQPLCWLHAAEYVRSVEGFLRARIGRTKDGAYWVEDFAPCFTARLDNCSRNVDMEKSKGVWGFAHELGSLYVSLAPVKRAEIALTDARPTRPCLLRSTSLLRNLSASPRKWRAEARLYAPGFLELQGMPQSASVSVSVRGVLRSAKTDASGVLKLSLPKGLGRWVEVSVGTRMVPR